MGFLFDSFVKYSMNDGYISMFTQTWKENISPAIEMGMPIHNITIMKDLLLIFMGYNLVDQNPQRRWNSYLTKLLHGKNIMINPECGLMFLIICKLLIGQRINQTLGKGDVHRSLAIRSRLFSMAYLEVSCSSLFMKLHWQ